MEIVIVLWILGTFVSYITGDDTKNEPLTNEQMDVLHGG